MRCRVKLFSTSSQILASDGSHIPAQVLQDYLNSDSYKNSIESKSMLGGLTHRARNLANAKNSGAALSKSIGKNDMMLLCTEAAAPVFYVTKLELMPDSWCYADIELFDEALADDEAAQNIKRLKYLLKAGVRPGVSAVVIGYWDSSTSGCDTLRKLVSISGLDITLNPSWKQAQVVQTWDDEGNLISGEERNFSEIEYTPKDFEFKGLKVKAFSDLNSLGCGDMIKSSKIDGKFTKLKAKVYSADGMVEEIKETVKESMQKNFSVVALRDRVREAKYSVRQRFRVLILSYRQLIKQQGGVEKIDPETLKIMKSLFTTDILDIMKTITPEIMNGKNPGTLLGASSLGKGVRQSVQKMFLPYKMAMSEVTKTGSISKARYQKIQQAYSDFTNAMIEEVFAPKTTGAKPIEEVIDENPTEETKK